MNPDLQSQTQTTNLPRDHEVLEYEIKLNTLKHSFAGKSKGKSYALSLIEETYI
ncbi:unnamed protein product, partial [Adineta steineri]